MRFVLIVIIAYVLSPVLEGISSRAMYKLEVRLDLLHRDFRPRPDYLYLYEPSRAATCDEFVGLLVGNFLNSPEERRHIGGNMLNSRFERLGGIQDFRAELVGGWQDTDLARHINGHAGALLRYRFAGQVASLYYLLADQGQRLAGESRSQEVDAEFAGNLAGRKVAFLMRRASKEWGRAQGSVPNLRYLDRVTGELSRELDKVLCDKNGDLAAGGSLHL